MSKFLFQCATPARCLSVCLSDDQATVSVAMVGSPIEFAQGKCLPPGYWEFDGERAEQVIETLGEWDVPAVFTLVWFWEYSDDAVFADPIPVTLPDVPEDTQSAQVQHYDTISQGSPID